MAPSTNSREGSWRSDRRKGRPRRDSLIAAIFEAIPSPAFIVDKDVRIVDFNGAAAAVLPAGGKAAPGKRGGGGRACLRGGGTGGGGGGEAPPPPAGIARSAMPSRARSREGRANGSRAR